jgi:hypothetical protein
VIFTLPNIAGFFIFFCGCLFLYLDIREEGKKGAPESEFNQDPFRCPICACIYTVERGKDLFLCPRCGTINAEGDACFR